MVQGVLGANVDFEIDILKKYTKLTKFGGAIKSEVLIQVITNSSATDSR